MYKLDPHIHSIYSNDSLTKVEDIIKKAREISLDVIAISDHNTNKGSKKAIELSKDYDDLLVVPSIEISSSKGHILGFGCEKNIAKGLSPEETIEEIRDNGGLAIIPHPFCFYRHGLLNNVKYSKLDFDAIEIKNARFIVGYCNNKAKKLSKNQKIPEIGSSDAHFVDFIGDCYTEIDCDLTIDSVLDAITKFKVKAKGKGTSNIHLSKYLINKNILKKY